MRTEISYSPAFAMAKVADVSQGQSTLVTLRACWRRLLRALGWIQPRPTQFVSSCSPTGWR